MASKAQARKVASPVHQIKVSVCRPSPHDMLLSRVAAEMRDINLIFCFGWVSFSTLFYDPAVGLLSPSWSLPGCGKGLPFFLFFEEGDISLLKDCTV